MIDSQLYGKKKNEIDKIEKILSNKLKRNDNNDLIKYENKLYDLLNEIIIINEQIVNELTTSIKNLKLLNKNIKNDEGLSDTEKNEQIYEHQKSMRIRSDQITKMKIETGKYKTRFQELENRREKERLNALKEASENLKEAAEKARKDNYVNLKPIKIGAKTHNCRCKMKIQ